MLKDGQVLLLALYRQIVVGRCERDDGLFSLGRSVKRAAWANCTRLPESERHSQGCCCLNLDIMD